MRKFQQRPPRYSKRGGKRRPYSEPAHSPVEQESAPKAKKTVAIPEIVSVKDYAERAGLPVTSIISELMKNGVLATINETIDFDTASIIGDDLNLEIVREELPAELLQGKNIAGKNVKDLVDRPPVVTVMGHVDHGKTSLLDRIREAKVAEGESGGITQHISAYQVELRKRKITFIDTPGHAAFSAMRGHGASITDIVVLIVAANDGVMPQTIEVIEQAKANNVPLVVAINKVDLPDADVMKAKQQLAEHELVSEDWGGKTVMVEVSAKTGKGIDDLLEMILLQADMMELKANPKEMATGVVIEAKMSKGHGATALVLIENGTLKLGDPVAIGSSYGRVRILEDFTNRSIKSAGPSFPVRVAGLKTLPNFGDRLLVFENEKEAKENAVQAEKQIVPKLRIATAKKMTEEETEEKINILTIILKSDVRGSLEAIRKMVGEISAEGAEIHIISEGVGAISESDVTMAKATGAHIFGFRVKELGAAKKIAEKEDVSVHIFNVIYELVDKVKEELANLLPPEIIEEELGRGKVLAIFRDDKKGFVAGGKVESGRVSIGSEIKILQNNNEKYRNKIVTLRKEKSEAKECLSGTECGFGLPPHANVAVGDTFIVFKTEKKKRVVQ